MVIHVRVSVFVMCCHQILMNVRASMEYVKYTVSTRMAHTIVIIKKVTALLLMIPHVGVSPDKDIIILSGSL